jgi:hypothetical protein
VSENINKTGISKKKNGKVVFFWSLKTAHMPVFVSFFVKHHKPLTLQAFRAFSSFGKNRLDLVSRI